MAYIPWWQRYEAPTFAERFELGGLAGRVGFSEGTDIDRYNKVRPIVNSCLLYTSPSPRDRQKSRMPSSA